MATVNGKMVEFTLKGKKRTAQLSSLEAAQGFLRVAAKKWGTDFQPITSGISGIEGPKPEGLKEAGGQGLLFGKEQGVVFTGRYITISKDERGNLLMSATPEGREDAAGSLAAKPTDSALAELLEEAMGNGWSWEDPEELGALTDAPIISDPDGNVYWHERYQVEDPIQMLADGESVRFDLAGNKNEEVEETVPGSVVSPESAGAEGLSMTGSGKVAAKGKVKITGGFNFFFPGQALKEFYPEIQHEIVDYPNATNAPMDGGIVGDIHEKPEDVDAAVDGAFDGMTRLGYISTSPSAAGVGPVKPQVLEGQPFRTESQVRGPMFMEEFYQRYAKDSGGTALRLVVAKRAAAFGGEKEQFGSFLKKVMAEVAATFVAAWKVTSHPPFDKVPGTGELQLDQVEQQPYQGMSSFNIIDSGSRVKHLVEKLNDSDIQDCINDAWAQAAVWCSSPGGGVVYEVFVRAETLDSESLKLKYKFVTGTKDSKA